MLRGFRPGSAVGLAYLGFVSLGVRSSLPGITRPSIRADFDAPLAAPGALLVPSAPGHLVARCRSGRALARSQIVHQHPPDFAHRGATMWQTLRLPAAWLSMLLFIVYTGVELSIGQWAFPLLVSARGLGTVEAGAAVSAYWAGLTLGRLFFGGIVATIGVARLLQACLLTVLGGLGLLWRPAARAMQSAAPGRPVGHG